jgi:hypothetical protein
MSTGIWPNRQSTVFSTDPHTLTLMRGQFAAITAMVGPPTYPAPMQHIFRSYSDFCVVCAVCVVWEGVCEGERVGQLGLVREIAALPCSSFYGLRFCRLRGIPLYNCAIESGRKGGEQQKIHSLHQIGSVHRAKKSGKK